mmetsp:Transcript_27364/g.41622  ORF Transcript_27364/g.41622 Transcript_27364/m.41622 type:complete len:771 (+) Transcript_27364:151-2463(+)
MSAKLQYGHFFGRGAKGTPEENERLLKENLEYNKDFTIHKDYSKTVDGHAWPDNVHTVNYDQNNFDKENVGWTDCIYYSFAQQTAKFVVFPYVCEGRTIHIAYEFHLAQTLRERCPEMLKSVNFQSLMNGLHFSVDGIKFGYHFGYTSIFSGNYEEYAKAGDSFGIFKSFLQFTKLISYDKEPIASENLGEEKTLGSIFFTCLPLDMRLYQYRFRTMILESQLDLASKFEDYAAKQFKDQGKETDEVKKYVNNILEEMKKVDKAKAASEAKTEILEVESKKALTQLIINMRKMKVPLLVDGKEITLGDICDWSSRATGVLASKSSQASNAVDAMVVAMGGKDVLNCFVLEESKAINLCLGACQRVINSNPFNDAVCPLINFVSSIQSWIPSGENLGPVFQVIATGALALPDFFNGIPFIGTILKNLSQQAIKFYGDWLRPIFLNDNHDFVNLLESIPRPKREPPHSLMGTEPVEDTEEMRDDGENRLEPAYLNVTFSHDYGLKFHKLNVHGTIFLYNGRDGSELVQKYRKVEYQCIHKSRPEGTRCFYFPAELVQNEEFPEHLNFGQAYQEHDMYIAVEPGDNGLYQLDGKGKVYFYLTEQMKTENKVPAWPCFLARNVPEKPLRTGNTKSKRRDSTEISPSEFEKKSIDISKYQRAQRARDTRYVGRPEQTTRSAIPSYASDDRSATSATTKERIVALEDTMIEVTEVLSHIEESMNEHVAHTRYKNQRFQQAKIDIARRSSNSGATPRGPPTRRTTRDPKTGKLNYFV